MTMTLDRAQIAAHMRSVEPERYADEPVRNAVIGYMVEVLAVPYGLAYYWTRPSEVEPDWSTRSAAYHTVHRNLQNRRGSASGFPCYSCGARHAREWALSHDAKHARTQPRTWWSSGRQVTTLSAASPDLRDYIPLCRACHIAYDRRAS